MQALFGILAFLPAVAFGYVTWRLVRHCEWIATAISGLITIACLLANPFVQMGADQLLGRPYAENLKIRADEADIIGKDFAYVIETLGEPDRIRVETPAIAQNTTREISKVLPPYTALDYYRTSAVYLTTRFIVFLDQRGRVTGYRVKWERQKEKANQAPQRNAAAARLRVIHRLPKFCPRSARVADLSSLGKEYR
jgi:hypothetical protein